MAVRTESAPLNESKCPEGALWVYLEHGGGSLAPVTLELLGKARELSQAGRLPLVGMVMGNGVEDVAGEAARYGVEGVVVLDDPEFSPFSPELATEVVAEAVERYRPDVFLMGATPEGRDLAGRLAVRLRTGLTADCTEMEIGRDGLLLGHVAGFGGGVLATILCKERRPQMATARPGVFVAPDPGEGKDFWVERFEVGETLRNLKGSIVRTTIIEEGRHPSRDLSKAPAVVIAGRGVWGNMEPLKRLADRLGGEVGATRVPIDEGWIGRDVQIGQTGLSVRPDVALVLGASGAFQFTVGIQGAGTVISVNTSADAPIFEDSDYCVVADAVEVVEALLEELEKRAGNGQRGGSSSGKTG